MVKPTSKGFAVYNHSGTKKLSRDYPTRQQAQQRLNEIEFFKNKRK